MKFESLISKKFEDFEKNELQLKTNFLGGKCLLTGKMGEKGYSDKWDDSTGNDVHCTDGSNYDWGCATPAPINP